jgi:hypothetical protein
MALFWRPSGELLRWRAVRKLYRSFMGKDTPEARGRRLLRQWLSTEQRKQFDASNSFEVVGCHTGNRYRIHYGIAANVQELDQAGNLKMGWCFVPLGFLVPGDVMLAQKIALETDERSALAVANIFPPERRASRMFGRPF